MTVPTILQLTDEIDRFEKEEKDKNVSKDYKKTSLREPMKVFDEFLSKLSENWRGKLMEKSDASKNFWALITYWFSSSQKSNKS